MRSGRKRLTWPLVPLCTELKFSRGATSRPELERLQRVLKVLSSPVPIGQPEPHMSFYFSGMGRDLSNIITYSITMTDCS